ncbi:hypothetical protein EV421DRAFT_1794562 [Armillaria borealis]|uniref:BTB domain-containing protein n=1 Tax=Armillaria borealis TaxID=47425 RepID=A0AA39JND8_9AGAR|nr:hypothetical protein EV421DRAFT_1794562 [Armillaria borealis]
MNASPPFDGSDPTSDIILVSSDGVRFHAHKLLLSLASPFFKDLITLAQAPIDGSLPSVPLTESSSIIDKILRFCYPIKDATFDKIAEIYLVAEAMHKYLMEDVTNRLPSELRRLTEVQPLRAFVVACAVGWKEEAAFASKKVLEGPLLIQDEEDIPELKHLGSVKTYHRLLKFHQKRLDTIKDILQTMDEVHAMCTGNGPSCHKHDIWDEPPDVISGYMHGFPRKSWLLQYTVSVLQAMQRSPTIATLEQVDSSARSWARKVAESCSNCLEQCADCGGLDDVFERHVKYEVLGGMYSHLGKVSGHRA